MRLIPSNWCCQGFFDSPTCYDSFVQRASINSQFSRPLGNSEPLAFIFKEVISAGIICLLNSCGPVAISGPSFALTLLTMPARVMALNIDSIKTIRLVWARAHIFVKILEAGLPVNTDTNTSGPIIWISFIVRTYTSIKHRSPYPIFACSPHSVLYASATRSFFLKTATTFSIAIFQAASNDNAMYPAIAQAQPSGFILFTCAHKTKHNKTTKALARQVYNLLVGYGDNLRESVRRIIVGVHKNLPFLCQAWNVCSVARHFSLVRTPVIVPQLGGTS